LIHFYKRYFLISKLISEGINPRFKNGV